MAGALEDAATRTEPIQTAGRCFAKLGSPKSGRPMDEREQRLLDLQAELEVLRIVIGSMKNDSPQQCLLIDSYWPMLANVHALGEELSDEQLENRSY